MNFRTDLEKYLELSPKSIDKEVEDHFRGEAKPLGVKDDIIDDTLRKFLAKREAQNNSVKSAQAKAIN